MSQPSRRYTASAAIARQGRADSLPAPVIDWREVRRWILPLSLLVAAVVLYLLQSSFATTSELDIARMGSERDVIQRQNSQLLADIAQLEKPTYIRERAAALGLVDVSKSVKVAVQPIPQVQDISTPVLSDSAPPSPWERFISELARWLAGNGQ